jgi:hypothetical protein
MNRFENQTLSEIMCSALPSPNKQKRLQFRPTLEEVTYIYDLLNLNAFDNQLKRPDFVIRSRCRKFWGMCIGEHEIFESTQSYCKIILMDKWYCVQWLVTILAHEMCHQEQWDRNSEDRIANGKDRLMSHGPSFFKYRKRLAEHKIPLKTAYGFKRWMKHQNMLKT